MQIIGYEISQGARFQPGVKPDAATIGNALEDLRKHYKGELQPTDVVEAARSKNHPLHDYFEWDDSEAAHQHRLQQARGLIRSVVAIYKQKEPERPVVRAKAFTHIAQGETSHYRDTGHAMSQKDTRQQVLQRAWRELQAWRQRYKDLKQFSALFEAIDSVEKKLPAGVRKAS